MIAFDGTVKAYGSARVVDGLSLEVAEGEVCVLIGPSGCGKTTSMRMVNRLVTATAGRVLVRGRDNRTLPAEALRREIGYAIQQIGLFPHMTVGRNVGVVPRLLGWEEGRIRRRVDELLTLVGLSPERYRDAYPRQLSGGQQQRVGVARALGADPPILLMDEPFGAVDPVTRAALQDEFLNIQRSLAKTILFVTHDIDEAIKMGDRVALLRAGKLVQVGTPDELLAAPKDAFVRDFVGADRQLKRLGLVAVSEVMSAPPVVAVGETLGAARTELERRGLGSVFVVDEGGHLRGVLDEGALEPRAAGPVRDAMTPTNPHEAAVRETATVRDALSAMVARGFQVTPVVDAAGRLVGAVTLAALRTLGAGERA